MVNSLAPERFRCDFELVIFKLISRRDRHLEHVLWNFLQVNATRPGHNELITFVSISCQISASLLSVVRISLWSCDYLQYIASFIWHDRLIACNILTFSWGMLECLLLILGCSAWIHGRVSWLCSTNCVSNWGNKPKTAARLLMYGPGVCWGGGSLDMSCGKLGKYL